MSGATQPRIIIFAAKPPRGFGGSVHLQVPYHHHPHGIPTIFLTFVGYPLGFLGTYIYQMSISLGI